MPPWVVVTSLQPRKAGMPTLEAGPWGHRTTCQACLSSLPARSGVSSVCDSHTNAPRGAPCPQLRGVPIQDSLPAQSTFQGNP